MENKYNIGLISKILNIPRSTLRYWESEGLINLKRNKENDYREFDVSSIFEILDIALYRKLNISIKEIKKMENQNVKEIEKVLIKNKENIDKSINELKYTKTLIEKRINQIQIYYELINNTYQKADKIENIKSFELADIFDCGQCFRWNKEEDGSYTGVVGHNVLYVKKNENEVTITGLCSEKIEALCKKYFDLETDYEAIKEKLSKIDDNLIEKNYSKILNGYKDLVKELNLTSSLDIANLFSILLWNGYFSENKNYL